MQTYSLSLGEKILVFRHRANLSKTELAERIGVTASTITNYEKGKTVPSQEIMENLSIALNISINMLMFGFDDPAKDLPVKKLI